MNSHELGVLMIRSVVYERRGWKVLWKQQCDHCGTEETAMRNAYIRCKCGCFTRLNDADEWHCKKCGNVWD